jgi:hypothetical protein
MMMLEKNNLEIAVLMAKWLNESVNKEFLNAFQSFNDSAGSS